MPLPRSSTVDRQLPISTAISPAMAARRHELNTRAIQLDAHTPQRNLIPAPSPIVAPPSRPGGDIAAELEAEIIAALVRPLRPGENHQVGNANREQELREIFARLNAEVAGEILTRLELNRSDDELARAFGRIVLDRRARLRAFLADTRRRESAAGG